MTFSITLLYRMEWLDSKSSFRSGQGVERSGVLTGRKCVKERRGLGSG